MKRLDRLLCSAVERALESKLGCTWRDYRCGRHGPCRGSKRLRALRLIAHRPSTPLGSRRRHNPRRAATEHSLVFAVKTVKGVTWVSDEIVGLDCVLRPIGSKSRSRSAVWRRTECGGGEGAAG